MELVVLGSGTAIPDGQRGSPGFAVEVEGNLLFLDLGSGSLHRASRLGLRVEEALGVLLSHLHPDHTADLVPLLFAFRNPEYRRTRDLVLLGPSGVVELLADLRQVYGDWLDTPGYLCRVNAVAESEFQFGSWGLRCCPVRHGSPAVAYEITGGDGRRLVYSGDTDECDALPAFASKADLLILECSFPEGHKREGHLTPSQAGRMAAKAECGRLVLTHFYPVCRGEDLLTPCGRFYQGPIVLAEDGLRIKI